MKFEACSLLKYCTSGLMLVCRLNCLLESLPLSVLKLPSEFFLMLTSSYGLPNTGFKEFERFMKLESEASGFSLGSAGLMK